MAEHGEARGHGHAHANEHAKSREKKESHTGEKHSAWMDKAVTALGVGALGTLTANYLLALATGIVLPVYIMSAMTLIGAGFLFGKGGPEKKAHSGGGHH